MRAAIQGWRHSARRALAAAAVFAAIFSVSIGPDPAAAEPASADVNPGMYPESDGHFGNEFFPLNPSGAALAQMRVANCDDAFCTIQIQRYRGQVRYELMVVWGCDTWRLDQFSGSFHAKNGGTLTVHFLDASRRVIGRYWGGRHDVVDWDPVWFVRTCNRS